MRSASGARMEELLEFLVEVERKQPGNGDWSIGGLVLNSPSSRYSIIVFGYPRPSFMAHALKCIVTLIQDVVS